jgi:hypothetical protein
MVDNQRAQPIFKLKAKAKRTGPSANDKRPVLSQVIPLLRYNHLGLEIFTKSAHKEGKAQNQAPQSDIISNLVRIDG